MRQSAVRASENAAKHQVCLHKLRADMLLATVTYEALYMTDAEHDEDNHLSVSVRPLAFLATWNHTFSISLFQTSLSTWHASFVTCCTRPTSAKTASIFSVEATDTPIDLIRREAIQRPADSS